MEFEAGHIYHVFNRGNNRNRIFFHRENYFFFLRKIKKHVLPYTSILVWCLMPTCFHLMIYVHRKKLPDRSKDLNHSIGQMLSSYTRAVQNQMKIEGSLFQQRTKAICLSRNVKIASAFYGKEFGMVFDSCLEDFSFPHICFDCIHNHPVQNGLVEIPEDWEFSSCRDYYFERGGRLIDCKLADRELGIVRV